MGEDVLSKDEVESLLKAMDVNAGADAPPVPPATPPAPSGGRSREKVDPYDFKRPERVGKEQMRSLQSLHEGFSRNFGASLSALLRTIVEVRLTDVKQMTYSDFVFGLENPTCFNLVKAEPLEGNFILDINPSVLYPIIDRLLGGGKETGPLQRRPMTEIEMRLVRRITDRFLEELKRAWENVIELDLSVERLESNPQLIQIVPPNEVVVQLSFEISLNGVRGETILCIPFNTIERIGNKLSANSWIGYGKGKEDEKVRKTLGRRLNGSVVELEVTLAETKITTRDLLGLRVGDIITTEKDIHTPLKVSVQGIPKFAASAGALKGQKAIRVEDAMPQRDAG